MRLILAAALACAAGFAKAGVDVAAGTPEHFKTFLDAEVARWAKVVKDAGIKAD